MIVSIIAAMDRRALIGQGGGMPWRLPRDLRRFREHTWGKPVIMGRRTLESLDGRLKGRFHIVLSREPSYVAAGCRVVHSIEDGLSAARDHTNGMSEAMVIGGGVVFREMMPLCTKAYITIIDEEFEGDTYFPLDAFERLRWKLVRREYGPPDEKNLYRHWFLTMDRLARSEGCDHDEPGTRRTRFSDHLPSL